jgi:DNA-binding HxlR family transcriptional regulator
MGKRESYVTTTEAIDVEAAFKLLEGRWKFLILFQLFDGQVRRFSDLEKLIPGVTQKMLAQQLRRLEHDGLVSRTVYNQVPPKVEYRVTDWGQALCPALEEFMKWAERRDDFSDVTACDRKLVPRESCSAEVAKSSESLGPSGARISIVQQSA